MSKKNLSFNIIYRVCDSCESYNTGRTVGTKKDVLAQSMESLKSSIMHGGENIHLHVVFDNTSDNTKNRCKEIFEHIVDYHQYCTSGITGNMASFKMSYDIAKTLNGFIFFLEDDYILTENCIDEMRWFMSRFDDSSHICVKPHHEEWSFTRDNIEGEIYFTREVLLGKNIYWVRDLTSTCTFCIDDYILNVCSDLFEKTFLLDRVKEDYINKIWRCFPLFCCIPAQGIHFQCEETFNPFFNNKQTDPSVSYSQSKCRKFDCDINEKVCDMRPDYNHVYGLNCLIDFVFSNGGSKPLNMIEVGSYAGQSMEIFVKSGMVKSIVCIDPWKSGWDKNDSASDSNMSLVEKLFDERMKSLSNMAKIIKFKGTLREFIDSGEYKKNIGDVGVTDFVYIDALHTYDGCKSDIVLSKDIICPRVAICGHDYNPPGWPGVCKAIGDTLGTPSKTFSDSSWCKLLTNKR